MDQRLVRQRHLQGCEHRALALYLVLVTVADAQGLSYYSDESLERMLALDHPGLSSARAQLCHCGLIAYQKPLYQVLALEEPTPNLPPPQRSAQVFSVQEILRHIFEKGGPA